MINISEKQLEFLKNNEISVYLTEENKLVLWKKKGIIKENTMVISIPKSGTYLLTNLLKNLGLEFIYCHLGGNVLFDDRENKNELLSHNERLKKRYSIPLAETKKFFYEGQCAASHLECNEYTIKQLSNFKKIFIYRNLKDVLVSNMKYLIKAQRDFDITDQYKDLPEGPEKLYKHNELWKDTLHKHLKNVIGWISEPDVICIKFEDLYGDFRKEKQYQVLDNICNYLGIPSENYNFDEILEKTIGSKTLTFSGQRSKRDIYWNEEIEKQFIDYGFYEYNKMLGYE